MTELLLSESVATKRCGACNTDKPLTAFPQHRQHKDGLGTICKLCVARKGRQWYRQRQKNTDGLYSTYVAMKQRCHNKHHENYASYGGRGIHVCEKWRISFAAFYSWARINGYRKGLQIDRINNDLGYSPENCRFVTPSENQRNKRPLTTPRRNNPTLTVEEVRQVRQLLASGHSQRDIGRRFGVTHGTIWAIKSGRSWIEIH
jgi:hypothetical protein